MKIAAFRLFVTQLILAGGLALGQTWVTETNLPAPGADQAPAVMPIPEVAAKARGVAQVTYANGLLRVAADNSSLDEILRSIARETGMKITGGVKDESVYGTYGPSTPSQVLAGLLDGTSSNMLFRDGSSNGPAELVLTPRSGSPTVAETPRSAPAPTVPVAVSVAAPATAPMWTPPTGNVRGNVPLPPVDPNLTQQQQNLQLMQQELQQQLQRQPQHGIPR
jgi:hypothetical protein